MSYRPCFYLLLLAISVGFAKYVIAADRAELFELYEVKVSNDHDLCKQIVSTVNDRIRAINKLEPDTLPIFTTWAETENLSRLEYSYRGDVLEADLDIDNDGKPEKVYKTRLSVRGFKSEALHIFASGREKHVFPDGITIKGLFDNANRRIDFLSHQPWVKRAKELHGKDWEKWFFSGTSVIYPLRLQGKTYVAAYHAFAAKGTFAKFYVFEVMPQAGVNDKCMLEKICVKGCAR